ncbi:MAG: sulfotransferase family protein [Gammaproteobacteria bacterium]|nr:sulfotransferase family protein [Gammaproteobacteria bacterium]
MKKIIALWAVPRSTSTAFEWMLRQRGDLTCFHEPYGEAWYQGEQPLWPRATADSVRTPGLTLDGVTVKLKTAAATDAVFIKDFPHYIAHLWSDELLAMFTHTFLIRHPAKTIPSMYDKWRDFHETEVGFPEQRALFDRIAAAAGAPPPVFDSDDLLAAPAEVTAWWCAQVGIEFMPAALQWQPGARDEVSWWDGGVFHANLRASSNLKKQPRDYIDIEDAPARVRAIYDKMLPHYEHMHRHRFVPAARD